MHELLLGEELPTIRYMYPHLQAATELNYGAQQLALSKVWRSPLAALVLRQVLAAAC
jgi:hypothetical protein